MASQAHSLQIQTEKVDPSYQKDLVMAFETGVYVALSAAMGRGALPPFSSPWAMLSGEYDDFSSEGSVHSVRRCSGLF